MIHRIPHGLAMIGSNSKGRLGCVRTGQQMGVHLLTSSDATRILSVPIYLTAGRAGIREIRPDGETHHETTAIDYPVDVSGAGDTVLAVLGLTNGEDVDLCNKAAGVQIMKRGVQQVYPHEIEGRP